MACVHLEGSVGDGEPLPPYTSGVSSGKFLNLSVLDLLRIKLSSTLMIEIALEIHMWLPGGVQRILTISWMALSSSQRRGRTLESVSGAQGTDADREAGTLRPLLGLKAGSESTMICTPGPWWWCEKSQSRPDAWDLVSSS